MATNVTLQTSKTTSAGAGFPGFLILTWTTSLNIAANKTILSWKIKGGSDYSDTSTYVYVGPVTVSINGVTVLETENRIQMKKNTVLGSGNITIAHDANGKKTVSVSIAAAIYEGSVNCTYSGKVALDTIPRATQPTLSSANEYMGNGITIKLPRADTSFTHDLAYSFAGGKYIDIATAVGSSFNWTVPDLAEQIPNSASGTLTVRCITKQGNKSIGTKTAILTVKVPASVVPTVTSVTVSENNQQVSNQFNIYVQNYSKLNVNIAAAGAKGSTIKSYLTTFDGGTYKSKNFTTDFISANGKIKMTTAVTDSRGRTVKVNTYITVSAYEKPKINSFSCYRCNASGEAADDGKYITVLYDYSVQSLNACNTANAVIEYKKSIDDSWSTLLTLSALSENTSAFIETTQFSTDYQYDIRLSVSDYFNSDNSYTVQLPSGVVIFDIKADGKGFAFFKTSDKDGVDFGDCRLWIDGASYNDTGWIEMELTTPWVVVTNSVPKYRKIGNVVYIDGIVKSPQEINFEQVSLITNLPEGFRPSNRIYLLAPCSGKRFVRYIIWPSGDITLEWVSDNTKFTADYWLEMHTSFII